MRNTFLVVVLLLVCGITTAQQLQEVRVSDPAKVHISWEKLNMLTGRLFAQAWIRCTQPVWGPLPYPSKITQTYGAKLLGESLLDVDEVHGIARPGWTWWKDETSGVHAELCEAGNWVVSTFVVATTQIVETPGPERVCTKVVTVPGPERVRTEVVTLQPVVIGPQPFINPAGATYSWTRPLPVITGSVVTGPMRDVISVGIAYIPNRPICRTQEPPSPYCPPGEAPPPPPPGNAGTPVVTPPTGPGNPTSPPPSAPDPPGHEQPWGPTPENPHIADPVLPGQ